jgi:cysteine desulfurase
VIHLDHNAGSPLRPSALERMLPHLTGSNASSTHRLGQRARTVIDDAREELAVVLSCEPKELVFTSGGTEADNLALFGSVGPAGRLVTTSVEHPAVREAARRLARSGVEVVELPVGSDGALDWAAAERAIVPGTALVSAMWVNNETGVLFDVERLGLFCRERGVRFHVDAVQALGRVPVDVAILPADLISFSAHKVGGPQGVGALFVRRGVKLDAVAAGGLQERGRRPGTENVAGIVGFAAAAGEAEATRPAFVARAESLGARLRERLSSLPGLHFTAGASAHVASTVHLCVEGAASEALLMGLDLAGICASAGSACASGSLEPSHVLRAMGVRDDLARGALRLSFGPETNETEIDRVAEELQRLVPRLRAGR